MAQDYLLALDEKTTNLLLPEDRRREETTASMEVVVRLDVPFHARFRIGPEAALVEGVLSKDEQDEFRLDVRCQRLTETGERVPVGPGLSEEIRQESTSRSTITLQLDTPVVMGGIETNSTSTVDGNTIHEHTRQVRTVVVRKQTRRRSFGAASHRGQPPP